MREHKLSFVVTARNESASVLQATIQRLLETSSRYVKEIVVIDDGSDLPVTCAHYDVLLIRNPEPIGVSRSRRYGASMATGDVLVWLDGHMTFSPDWLDLMLAHVDSGALLCSAFWDYAQSTCHCWGADFVWCGERNYVAHRYPGFGLRHRTRFPGEGAVEVPMIIGACYMLRRDSYERLGGFSPLFRVWGADEQDLSARAWIGGIGVKCVTRARVGHLWRPSFPYPVQFEHLEFNQLVMLRTVFEEATVGMLEEYFQPVPVQVQKWLDEARIAEWRTTVQACRQLSDADFFRRFSAAASLPFRRPSRWPSVAGRAREVLRRYAFRR